jgi:hypothetical protein
MSRSLRSDLAALERQRHRVGAGRGAELRHRVAHVCANRLRREDELLRRLLPGQALGDQPEDLALARREDPQAPVSGLGEQRREPWVEVLLAPGNRQDRLLELCRVAALQREARRAGVQALEQLGLVGRPGVEEDAQPGVGAQRSTSATSGFRLRISASAASALSAVPMTWCPERLSRSSIPRLSATWSSTITTLSGLVSWGRTGINVSGRSLLPRQLTRVP